MEFDSVKETLLGETAKPLLVKTLQSGFPSTGHLRIARIDWTISQVDFICAVSVSVGGAHEETLGQAGLSSPMSDTVTAENLRSFVGLVIHDRQL